MLDHRHSLFKKHDSVSKGKRKARHMLKAREESNLARQVEMDVLKSPKSLAMPCWL